jgi:AcrR family transcriptional regulator
MTQWPSCIKIRAPGCSLVTEPAGAVRPVARGRGRPARASRDDVVAAGLSRYLHGQRIDVLAIAAELGLGRATIYRWFGSREGLVGEVLIRAGDPLLDTARREASGTGAVALLDTFDRMNRSLVAAQPLRRFIELERDALRIVTSSAGVVQPHFVGRITALIEDEVRAGAYEPPVDPATLGYAIVRLAEAFIYSDAAAGVRGDVDRLLDVEAALLGVRR